MALLRDPSLPLPDKISERISAAKHRRQPRPAGPDSGNTKLPRRPSPKHHLLNSSFLLICPSRDLFSCTTPSHPPSSPIVFSQFVSNPSVIIPASLPPNPSLSCSLHLPLDTPPRRFSRRHVTCCHGNLLPQKPIPAEA